VKVLAVLVGLVIAVAAGALLGEAGAFGGAWILHQQGRYDDEIRWLASFEPLMRWEPSVARRMEHLETERLRRALDADRVDRAVHLFRAARARAGAGGAMDPDLMLLGIETFRRAADRMAKHGRLSEAADWNDSLFVLGIRAPASQHRYAALAGFMEGLDLRVRDGKPCAALARVQWAKRGLGGVVPGMASKVEEDLTIQCAQQRRAAS
jgi:hypothetical protein